MSTPASTCPALPAIDGKIAEVLTAIQQADGSVVNHAPHIDSPSCPGFAQTIDHTLLKPDATAEQIDRLCEEAKRFGFKVCGSHR